MGEKGAYILLMIRARYTFYNRCFIDELLKYSLIMSSLRFSPILLLFITPALAAHSFEGNSLTAGGWNNTISPQWTEGGNRGNRFEEHIVGFSADGKDHLGMKQGHSVWQDLPEAPAEVTSTTSALMVREIFILGKVKVRCHTTHKQH